MKKISLSLVLICGIIFVALEGRAVATETANEKKSAKITDFSIEVKNSTSSASAKITPETAPGNDSKEVPAKAPSALPGETITISGKLMWDRTWPTDDQPIPGQPIKIYFDGTEQRTVTTGSDGKFSYDYTVPTTTGSYTIEVKFEGNDEYMKCSASETLTIKKKPTRIADFKVKVKDSNSSSAPTRITIPETSPENSSREVPEKAPSALPGATITISGKLVEDKGYWSSDPPISNQTIEIYFASELKKRKDTDGAGTFSHDYTVPTTTGSYTIEARFAGNEKYEECSASETLTVEKRVTKIANLSVSSNAVLPEGTVQIKGRLEWENWASNDPISGETIKLYDNDVEKLTITTENDGWCSCDYPIPANANKGMHTIKAVFPGTTIYKTCEASVQLEVELVKEISVTPATFDPYEYGEESGKEKGQTKIAYTLVAESDVTIEVCEENKVLKTLVNSEKKQAEKHTTEWYGIINDDDYGIFIAPNGTYTIKIKVKPVSGGAGEITKTESVTVSSP